MKNLYTIYILSLMAFAISGCVRTVDNIDLPESKPKLVIGSFICPQDTVIRVKVTKSVPLGSSGNTNNSVTDAQVIISEGGSSVSLSYDITEEVYTIDIGLFPIYAGRTYHLSVLTPDGLSASATCTIPLAANADYTITPDSTTTTYGTNHIVKTEITDIPGQRNFYRVGAFLFTEESSCCGPNYVSTSQFEDYETNGITSDEGKDGAKLYPEILYNYSYYQNIYVVDKYIKAYLLTIDYNYYEYYRTKGSFSNDPFSEPVQTYTNIVGGLGVFAGYQLHEKIVDIP